MATTTATSKPTINVLLLGGGSLGAIYGYLLSITKIATVRVTVVCRSNYEAVSTQGYTLKTVSWGNHTFHPFRVVRSAGELSSDDIFDYAIVSTKVSNDLSKPPVLVQYPIQPSTAIVLIQNGIGIEEPYRKAFPENTIISGVIYITAAQPSLSEIHQTGETQRLLIGLYDGIGKDPKAEIRLLTDMLTASSDATVAVIPEDMQEERWRKLMWNGTFNCSCAITGLDTHGVIYASQASEIFINGVLDELYEVACATLGRRVDRQLRDYALPLTKNVSTIVPSMLQDARKGVEMEVEALCGNVWRAADRGGVQAPRLQSMYAILTAMNWRFENAKRVEAVANNDAAPSGKL